MHSRFPEEKSNEIRNLIIKDMTPPLRLVHAKLFLAVGFGGLISLVLCGQFGRGMTDWAESFNHHLHRSMSSLLCALICGTLFAVFPTLLLRFTLCSPMQFFIIRKQQKLAVALWYGATGSLLATFGKHGQGGIEIVLWSLAAVLTSYLLAMILQAWAPLWSLPKSPQAMKLY